MGGRPAGPQGSAVIPQEAAGMRRLAAAGHTRYGSSGQMTSGRAQRPSDPAGGPSDSGARPPGLAGSPGRAACGDSASGSLGSVSQSLVQTGNLRETEQAGIPPVITDSKLKPLKIF